MSGSSSSRNLAEPSVSLGAASGEEATVLVSIDVWLEWILTQLSESRSNAEHYFRDLFPKFDQDQNHLLDLAEFTALVHAIDPAKNSVQIMDMYNMALECTPCEGDFLSKEAFVYTAMHYHLPHPSHWHHQHVS